MKTLDDVKQLMAEGETAKADESLKELLSVEPDNLQAKMLYGICRQLLGDEETFRRINDELVASMEMPSGSIFADIVQQKNCKMLFAKVGRCLFVFHRNEFKLLIIRRILGVLLLIAVLWTLLIGRDVLLSVFGCIFVCLLCVVSDVFKALGVMLIAVFKKLTRSIIRPKDMEAGSMKVDKVQKIALQDDSCDHCEKDVSFGGAHLKESMPAPAVDGSASDECCFCSRTCNGNDGLPVLMRKESILRQRNSLFTRRAVVSCQSVCVDVPCCAECRGRAIRNSRIRNAVSWVLYFLPVCVVIPCICRFDIDKWILLAASVCWLFFVFAFRNCGGGVRKYYMWRKILSFPVIKYLHSAGWMPSYENCDRLSADLYRLMHLKNSTNNIPKGDERK